MAHRELRVLPVVLGTTAAVLFVTGLATLIVAIRKVDLETMMPVVATTLITFAALLALGRWIVLALSNQKWIYELGYRHGQRRVLPLEVNRQVPTQR